MKFMFCVLVSILAFPAIAISHDGLVDSRGCHTDNNGTNYHCHPERLKEKSVVKKPVGDDDEKLKAFKNPTNSSNQRASEGQVSSPTYYNGEPGIGFNQSKANSALAWSSTLIVTTSIAGGLLAVIRDSATSEDS